jgi:hypothetical protein
VAKDKAIVPISHHVNKLWSSSPNDFPNGLTRDELLEDDFTKLFETIAKVEGEITAALATDEYGLEKWKQALASSRAAKGTRLFGLCGDTQTRTVL